MKILPFCVMFAVMVSSAFAQAENCTITTTIAMQGGSTVVDAVYPEPPPKEGDTIIKEEFDFAGFVDKNWLLILGIFGAIVFVIFILPRYVKERVLGSRKIIRREESGIEKESVGKAEKPGRVPGRKGIVRRNVE